jgi:hypothetical protein
MVSGTSITVWVISAMLAIGVGWSRYEKAKTRDKLVRELAAMDAAGRKKLLMRLRPEVAAEVRQDLMERFGVV